MRRTRLVCTLGPASFDQIEDLVEAGMDVARLNLSHGEEDEHRAAARAVREAAGHRSRAVALMTDLPGPKIRLGEVPGGEVHLGTGDEVLLGAGASAIPTSHPALARDLRRGDRVLLADGAVELTVVEPAKGLVRTEVVAGGTVRSGAGVNVPSERLSLPAVTERDRGALSIALDIGADFVAQSFVRRAEDLSQLRALCGDRRLRLVAKIETRAAVDDLDRILAAADALMLARGDLGVELPFAEVPVVQKQVVRAAMAAGVPVIVATQMLESMVHAPRPTRAEATDVANAVLDGADAVMLSAETAIGEHPLAAARAAVEICLAAETSGETLAAATEGGDSDPAAIAAAAAALASGGGSAPVAAIACFTRTGLTADLLSARRPGVPIFALSPDEQVLRWLALRRGVVPVGCTTPRDTDEMIDELAGAMRGAGLEAGERVVMVASIPFGAARTNFLKLHRL